MIERAWQGGEPPLMGLPFFRGQSTVHTIQTSDRRGHMRERLMIAPAAWLAMPAGERGEAVRPHGRGPS